MDRISVRSFRAVDLAERAIRDLARSRIDTTREAVFQPLSARFLEARSDAIRIAALFREDAFRTPSGYFSRLDLRPDAALVERLAVLEPRAVEARIEQATRAALARELPRADGVFLVRFEPSSRERLSPVAHVHLTSRLTDAGPAPAISREHAARLEERWSREMERAFGVRALALVRERNDRGPVPNPEGERLRQEWARASARLFAVYASRLGGKASREELTQAAAQARTARSAWSTHFGRAVDLREMDSRRTLDVVHVRIEGGAKYLSGSLEAHRKTVLEAAATRAAGLPEGQERHLAVVVWPAGRDLHAAVYFNQRSRPERLPGHIEPERLRGMLDQRLRQEIVQFVPTIDAKAGVRERDLGPVHARLPEVEPRLAARAERSHDKAIPVQRAMVVELARNEPMTSPSALGTGTSDAQARSSDHRVNEERDWSNERVFAVRVRIPTGAEQIDRYDLGPQETGRAIQRAIDRAYPFLAREGLRNNFLYTAHGRALDIRVLVPQKLGWTPEQLRSPQFQQRLVTGFYQAVSQLGTTRTAVERHPAIAAAERSIGLVRQAPQLLRQAEQDPERAARTLARAAFNRLSEALPKPFRMMREMGRALSRFARNE